MRKAFTLIELMIVIAIIAIIAAIAIPNLLESRITANESAASATLKAGIFPAEVQFQAGGYSDSAATTTAAPQASITNNATGGIIPSNSGGNGIGDFAAGFNQMAGGLPTLGTSGSAATGISLKLLPSTWSDVPSVGGSTYAGQNGTGTVTGPTTSGYIFAIACKNEDGFVANCAPRDAADTIGRRMFGINTAGIVYATAASNVNTLGTAAGAASSPFSVSMSTAAVGWSVYKK